MSAAKAVFSRTEYADVTVADILATAGVSRGTFYGYFASKEDVFLAMWRAHLAEAETRSRLRDSAGRPRPPHPIGKERSREIVTAAVVESVREWRTKPALMKAFATFKLLRPEFARPVLNQMALSLLTRAAWLRADADSGFLKVPVPELAFFAIDSMIEGLLFQIFGSSVLPFAELPDEELARQIVGIWFDGVYR